MADSRMFDAATYRQRRRQLLARVEEGLVLLLGNEMSAMNYAGNHYPFRQDGTFRYYVGLGAPGLSATLDADAGRVTLYGHDPSLDDVVWDGPVPSLEERAARAGIEETAAPEALAEAVEAARRQRRPVHVLPPYRARHRLRLARLLGGTPEAADERVSEKLLRAVIAQREVKSAAEVAEIERALVITQAMHERAMRAARPGVTEEHVAGLVEGAALQRGSHPSFPIIFSVRGEVFHNRARDYAMKDGELALCDAGAVSRAGYAGDVTRVAPVGGAFSQRQRDVYEVVLAGQQLALDAIRPGVTYRDVHLLAARRMTEGMKDLGFMKGDVDEAVAAGAHAVFFPHGLGHMLGLDAHDMEGLGEDRVGYDAHVQRSDQFGLNFLRMGKTLRPGHVLTVEPGIYFIPPLIDHWRAEGRHADFINYDQFEAYKGFGGIRIEDDVLVTEENARVLGPAIPKQPNEVEALAAE